MADHEPSNGYQRLITFSDAVFAIAATLLVIDLRPPAVPSDVYESALQAYLRDPAPFIATTIGFIVVGSYWSSHRRIFGLIGDTNGGVVWANLLFLFFVAIQPFLTAALAEHDPNRTSVLLYTIGQIAAGAGQVLIWVVALRHRELLTDRATPRRILYVDAQVLRAPVTFAVSIPITIGAGPTAGMASWGLLVLTAALIGTAFHDLEHPRRAPGRLWRALERRHHRPDHAVGPEAEAGGAAEARPG
ncbi:MAG TPA: TMEM175 family protein [Candidatus Binatus sp.]|nr:TMEM175 family protein [Candidatus Binatus sp.]